MVIVERGVDEIGVDKMRSRQSGNKPVGDLPFLHHLPFDLAHNLQNTFDRL